MHTLPNKWTTHMHLPTRHNMLTWAEHLIEDRHFWIVVAWIILILAFAFFATAPAY